LPLLIFTVLIVLPLVWMGLSSFKIRSEIIHSPVQWLPHHAFLGNFTEASREVPFARDFMNSVIVSVVGAGVKVLLSIGSAYGLVFCRFPFKRAIFVLILVTLMVPPQIAILPNYTLIAGLGGKNTYWGIILPGLGSAFGTFLLRQQFLTFPASLTEAAEIDGASHWRRLWSVVAPISAPSIATITLISLVTEWNFYIWPLIITDDPNMMTLPVGLSLLQSLEGESVSWGVLMAGTLVVIVPILIVFAALQRYIVTGLTQGAVKG
jgi:sn-glycerol 3-phosphate transport system permease protein